MLLILTLTISECGCIQLSVLVLHTLTFNLTTTYINNQQTLNMHVKYQKTIQTKLNMANINTYTEYRKSMKKKRQKNGQNHLYISLLTPSTKNHNVN